MKIGITGSRHGITKQQINEAIKSILPAITELHHGCCVGVDEAIHLQFVDKTKVILHPPVKTFFRFYPKPHENIIEIMKEKEYLSRNQDIVNDTEMLFSFPFTFKKQFKSGTWSTMNYAFKAGKKVYCIYPDGRLVYWNPEYQHGLESTLQDSLHK